MFRLKPLLVVLAAALAFSCLKRADEISIDIADPLALAPDIEWALVVSSPVASLRAEPSKSSRVVVTYEKGIVLPIFASAVFTGAGGGEERWYKFEQGWLAASDIEIYPNKFRAENAAKLLK